jgi:hypothetical protein
MQGTVTALRIGSYLLGPEAGLFINWLASAEQRAIDGQTGGQVVGGGISDAVGFTSVYGAFENQDPFTHQNLNWGTGQRWFNGIAGALQLGGIVTQAAGSIVGTAGPWLSSGLANAAQGVGRWSATASGGGVVALGGVGAWGASLASAGATAGSWGAAAASAGGWAGQVGGIGGLLANLMSGSGSGSTAFEILVATADRGCGTETSVDLN